MDDSAHVYMLNKHGEKVLIGRSVTEGEKTRIFLDKENPVIKHLMSGFDNSSMSIGGETVDILPTKEPIESDDLGSKDTNIFSIDKEEKN